MKKNILLVFGGQSEEHEISVLSAINIYTFFSKKKYIIFLLFIDKKGQWHLCKKELFKELKTYQDFYKKLNKIKSNQKFCIISKEGIKINNKKIDVIFPVLHGNLGEDGSFQGFCNILNIPCIGPSVLGASITFDKEFTKKLLQANNINTANFVTINKGLKFKKIFKKIEKHELSFPLFVKPARSGSSLGVNKVYTAKDLKNSLKEAMLYDNKVLIEEAIDGIELEIYCYKINNKTYITPIGDLITQSDLYTYEEKYLGKKVLNRIPSKVNKTILKDAKKLAIRTFEILDGRSIARIDMFLTKNNKVLINEVNTIPGYIGLKENNTLIKEAGIGYTRLIDMLINDILRSKGTVF